MKFSISLPGLVTTATWLLLFGSTTTTVGAAAAKCENRDEANPIAERFPDKVSGVLNGTTMIIPIPMEEARAYVPSKWKILEGAWKELLPEFPEGMYPMMASGVYDHDIRYRSLGLGLSIPDFSRASFEFPFVDILENGTPLRYAPTMLITSLSPAIAGVKLYGISPHGAAFTPSCNAYDLSPNGTSTFSASSTLNVPLLTTRRDFSLSVSPEKEKENPYSFAFIKNITNQITSATGKLCDNYERIYDTELTRGENAPVSVRGRVKGRLEPFETEGKEWNGVWGWRFATGFTEPAMPKQCSRYKS